MRDGRSSTSAASIGCVPGRCNRHLREEIDTSTNIEVQYLFSDFVASMSESDENQYTFRATPFAEEPFPGAYSYDWDFGDGNSSDEAITTHVFDGLSDYTVTLDVTSWVAAPIKRTPWCAVRSCCTCQRLLHQTTTASMTISKWLALKS